MSVSLSKIKVEELRARAKENGFRVAAVAKAFRISTRWLRVCLKARFGIAAHKLFAEWRASEVLKQAKAGKLGKELLSEANLKHCSSLTRSLRRDAKSGLRAVQAEQSGAGVLHRPNSVDGAQITSDKAKK